MSDRSTYRKRWLDMSYKAGYLKQIANAQAQFINHIARCNIENCVYNQETGECATSTEYYDKMIYSYEVYENYLTTGCPIETVADAERESEARSNPNKAGTVKGYSPVRKEFEDDEFYFGGAI